MEPLKALTVLAAHWHEATSVHHKADTSLSSGDFLPLAYSQALCIHALRDCVSGRRDQHVLLGC